MKDKKVKNIYLKLIFLVYNNLNKGKKCHLMHCQYVLT